MPYSTALHNRKQYQKIPNISSINIMNSNLDQQFPQTLPYQFLSSLSHLPSCALLFVFRKVPALTKEALWYDAEADMANVLEFADAWQGPRDLHMYDLFSASKKMLMSWTARGYKAKAFDLVLSREDDILAPAGFRKALYFGLRLHCRGLCFAGPPCSLFTFLSCSVHRRSLGNLNGHTAFQSVRMANAIARNTAVLLRVLLRRGCYVAIEQPKGSWLYKQLQYTALAQAFGLFLTITYMGCFGHDLPKPTAIMSNMPSATLLARRLTKDMLATVNKRFEKRQSKRKVRKEYYTKGKHTSGSKDMQSTAAYTGYFVNAVRSAWEREWHAQRGV
jgi:hypothetical protein